MSLHDLTDDLVRTTIALVLPPRCHGCGTVTDADHRFCAVCWMGLRFLTGPACPKCGDPFPYDLGPRALCGACMEREPRIDHVRAVVAYGPLARTLVLRLKHGNRPGHAVTLGRYMARLVDPTTAPLLIPIPLHRWRIWSRGYNQAALIAHEIAQQTRVEMRWDLLLRQKSTPMLRNMSPDRRRAAVRGAFRMAPHTKPLVAGRNIVLIDDVYTTGATANACSAVLKRAGAATVSLVCWARVVRGDAENIDIAQLQPQLSR